MSDATNRPRMTGSPERDPPPQGGTAQHPLREADHALSQWVEQCVREGWLTAADAAGLDAVERASGEALFAAQPARPLVVGFFGGTGVGKSSLLNRIAGEGVARVGVQRPTSHEVTLYVHQDAALAQLPVSLPVSQVRVARHSSQQWRDIAWIDAPDLDSVDEQNRRLTLAWLPHIDLLIYVVSPERYRDDVGWRVLLERRDRHGWVFVMNRCDEGDARQAEDFAMILRQAGFEEPVLVRTSCTPAGHACDQFAELAAILKQAWVENAGQAIALQAMSARARDLARVVESWASRFSPEAAWDSVKGAAAHNWTRVRESIEQGTEYAITLAGNRIAAWSAPVEKNTNKLARRFVASAVSTVAEHIPHSSKDATEAPPVARVAAAPPDPSPPNPGQIRELVRGVWDEWANEKLTMIEATVEVQAAQCGLATAPLVRAVREVLGKAPDKVRSHLEQAVRAALAQPGTRVQRAARRVTGFLTILLPGAALCWVAYAAVVNFHRGVSGGGSFAGTEFLVSAAILVVVAWALPFAADRLLKPSLERAATEALRAGRKAGLHEVQSALEDALAKVAAEGAVRWKQAQEIIERARRAVPPDEVSRSATVRRLLTRGHSNGHSDAGRATALQPADS